MRHLLLLILVATLAIEAAERAPDSDFMIGFQTGMLNAYDDQIRRSVHLLRQADAGTLVLPDALRDQMRKDVVTALMVLAHRQDELDRPARRLDERVKRNLTDSGSTILKHDPQWLATLRAVVEGRPFPHADERMDQLVRRSLDRYLAQGHPWALQD